MGVGSEGGESLSSSVGRDSLGWDFDNRCKGSLYVRIVDQSYIEDLHRNQRASTSFWHSCKK